MFRQTTITSYVDKVRRIDRLPSIIRTQQQNNNNNNVIDLTEETDNNMRSKRSKHYGNVEHMLYDDLTTANMLLNLPFQVKPLEINTIISNTMVYNLNYKTQMYTLARKYKINDEFENIIDEIAEDDEDQSLSCAVCFVNIPKAKLHPCGHRNICKSCFCKIRDNSLILQCPICREEVDGVFF